MIHKFKKKRLIAILSAVLLLLTVFPVQNAFALTMFEMGVEGTLTDDKSAPLSGYTITYGFQRNSDGYREGGNSNLGSDSDGKFSFTTNINGYDLGDWKLYVRAEKLGLMAETVITIEPGKTVNVPLSIDTHETFIVNITDPSGEAAPAGVPYWFTYVSPSGSGWPDSAPLEGKSAEKYTNSGGTISFEATGSGTAYPAGTPSDGNGALWQTGDLRYERYSGDPTGLTAHTPRSTDEKTIKVIPLGKIVATAKDSVTNEVVEEARFTVSPPPPYPANPSYPYTDNPNFSKYMAYNNGVMSIYGFGDLTVSAEAYSDPRNGFLGYKLGSATENFTPWGTDYVDVPMVRQSYGTIDGKVLNTNEQGVPGAQVELIYHGWTEEFSGTMSIGSTTADETGYYSFDDVIPSGSGWYIVKAFKNEYTGVKDNIKVSSGGTPEADVLLNEVLTDVCEIGAAQYSTLDGALSVVRNGETITLLKNITDSDGIKISGKKINLDLNGKTLTIDNNENSIEHNYGIGLEINLLSEVNITGAGILNINSLMAGLSINESKFSTSDQTTVSIVSSSNNGLYADTGCTVNINGDITGARTGVSASSNNNITVAGVVTVTGIADNTPESNNAVLLYETGNTVNIGSANASSATGAGICINKGGSVTVGSQADPGGIAGGIYGIWVRSEATTNAAVTVYGDVTGRTRGIYVTDNSHITVNGDVRSTLKSNDCYGVYGFINSDKSDINITGDVEGYNGVYIQGAQSTATVSGIVTATGTNPDNNAGVRASYATVSVGGDVTAAECTGAYAFEEAKITIGGAISAAKYIKVKYAEKAAGDYDAASSKAGYLQYSGESNTTVWVKGTDEVAGVCQIGTTQYPTLDAALAAITDNTPTTIKLLQNINYSGGLVIDNKKITFDLNTKTLTVTNGAVLGWGLDVKNNSNINTTNSGILNVTGNRGGIYAYNNSNVKVTNATGIGGQGVWAGGNSTVTVTNDATSTINTSGVEADSGSKVMIGGNVSGGGIYADGPGSEITVAGNITAAGTGAGADARSGAIITVDGSVTGANQGVFSNGANSSVMVKGNVTATGETGIGVYANNGGTATIDGTITAPNYIKTGSTAKTAADKELITTKSDYLTYTDGTSTVWVKDTSPNVCEIAGTGYKTLAGALAAVTDGQTVTIRLLQNIDYNSGITIEGGDNKHITFDLNGFTLNVVNASGAGIGIASGSIDYIDNTAAPGQFNVTGREYGVWANGTGTEAGVSITVKVTNARATAVVSNNEAESYGVYARYGAQVTVTQNARGDKYGAYADSASGGVGSKIVVSGSAIAVSTGAGIEGIGAIATNNARVEVAGIAQGRYCGVSAKSQSSALVVGNASGGMYGVYGDSSTIRVTGNAESDVASGAAVCAYASPASIMVGGNAKATGADGAGARAIGGGQIVIDGSIDAAKYVQVGAGPGYVDLAQSEGVLADGYYVYIKNDISSSRVKVKAAAQDTGNGSSGGHGGGTSTPAYNASLSGSGGTSTLAVTVNAGSNNATIGLNAEQGGSIAGGGAAAITVPSIPGVSSYTLNVPANSLSTSDGAGTLTLNTDIGDVTLPADMLADVTGAAGKNAQITIGQGDKSGLPDDVKAAIGDRPIVQLTLALNGTQTEWNNPDAPVTVTIPYTPTAAELADPENIVVWYIDGSGNAVSVPNGHYDPATGTVTFSTTHFSYYAVCYKKVNFNDVASGAWYFEPVSFIAARGITTGTGGGKFAPDAKLTRGEFIVMMMKAYGIEPDTNPDSNFSDAGSTYYTGYLASAKRLGISSGLGGNMFVPGKEITRQEMFTLLYNALKVIDRLPEGTSGKDMSSFSDADQIASWAKDAMAMFTETGIVGGSNGKLSPAATTTRAEMAQVLYNLLLK